MPVVQSMTCGAREAVLATLEEGRELTAPRMEQIGRNYRTRGKEIRSSRYAHPGGNPVQRCSGATATPAY